MQIIHGLVMWVLVGGLLISGLSNSPTASCAAAEGQGNQPANPAQATEAAQAWQAVVKALRPPDFPADWRTNRPSPEALAKFRRSQGELAFQAAEKARGFYTRFPQNPNAAEAREKEKRMLETADRFGNASARARLDEIASEKLKDDRLGAEERFQIRVEAVQRAARMKQNDGLSAAMFELERGARELMREFPQQGEVYRLLLGVAANSPSDKARAIFKEIIDGAAPEDTKAQARGILKKMELVGQPVNVKFTALDGRKIDLSKWRDRVVLIDFWATWCGPCLATLPQVKAAYQKYHDQGFEIVGINFDKDKAALERFVAGEKMPWPQYFDGLGWQNKYGLEFGISSLPAMWLVDKQGNLRDLNARERLDFRVEQLIAEKLPGH